MPSWLPTTKRNSIVAFSLLKTLRNNSYRSVLDIPEHKDPTVVALLSIDSAEAPLVKPNSRTITQSARVNTSVWRFLEETS